MGYRDLKLCERLVVSSQDDDSFLPVSSYLFVPLAVVELLAFGVLQLLSFGHLVAPWIDDSRPNFHQVLGIAIPTGRAHPHRQ